MHVAGKCHCGRVSFTAEVDESKVMVCHCDDCQSISGAAFRANAVVPIESFKITGPTKSYVKVAQSGNQRAQVFCPECGTALYSAATENPSAVVLRLGCVQQRAQLAPKFQIWQRSAMPWVGSLAAIESFAEQPSMPTPPAGVAQLQSGA